MNPNERLKKVRKYAGLTQEKFGEKIGLKQSQIKDIETAKQKVSPELAEIIEINFSINGWWLLTGKGEMLIKDEKKQEHQGAYAILSQEDQELLANFKELPSDLQEIYKKEIELEALKVARKKRQNNITAPTTADKSSIA